MKRKSKILTKLKEQKVPNNIWKYQGNTFKAHCTDIALAKRIASWDGCERSGTYYRVAELLKSPLRQKNPKRVAHGREMSVINKKHRFLRNTKLQKSTSEGASKEKSLGTLNVLRTE